MNFIKSVLISSILALSISSIAIANHGPGTSGGGSSTESGETLKEGQFAFSLREAYTNYDHVHRAEAEERASKSGEFDALRDAYVTSVSMAYGVTNDFQLELTTGWYSGRGFIDAHREGHHEEESGHHVETLHGGVDHDEPEHSETDSALGNPEGLSDLSLRAKYRVMKGKPGNLSLIGGVTFPTGNDTERLSNGERLEPSSQPGTGRFAYDTGLSYSRYLTSHITLDTSSIYTFRVKRDAFEVGDRWDSGAALSYRVTDSIQSFPQVSLFAEVRNLWLGKDEKSEGKNPNTGGNTLYLTPGARLRFNESVGFTLAPSIPVVQDLNGDQIESDFQVLGQLGILL